MCMQTLAMLTANLLMAEMLSRLIKRLWRSIRNMPVLPYRIGKVYQTQGAGQEAIYMKYFNDAIAMDPKYAPAYYNLFNYYYETNVPRSAEYLDKWLANSDDDPKACYYRASMKYAQGLFNEAITKADECITAGGANPYPNLFGLKAYAYNRLKDSVNAKTIFEEYFTPSNRRIRSVEVIIQPMPLFC